MKTLILITALILVGCIVEPIPEKEEEFTLLGEWCTVLPNYECIEVDWYDVFYEDAIWPQNIGLVGKLTVKRSDGVFYYTHYNDTLEVEIGEKDVLFERK